MLSLFLFANQITAGENLGAKSFWTDRIIPSQHWFCRERRNWRAMSIQSGVCESSASCPSTHTHPESWGERGRGGKSQLATIKHSPETKTLPPDLPRRSA